MIRQEKDQNGEMEKEEVSRTEYKGEERSSERIGKEREDGIGKQI
jgi:hypothetical protein